LPLSGYQDNKFKLYLLDIGLLGAMISVPQKAIIDGDSLFSEYSGAFVENYVAQEFVANGQKDLYYWSSKNTAEVDFVVALKNQILPLEVKAGISKQKKSLRVYGEKFNPPVLSRSTLMNFKEDGKIRNYPLYAVSLFLRS
jgi:predicted AAA+ superfamily ATPase